MPPKGTAFEMDLYGTAPVALWFTPQPPDSIETGVMHPIDTAASEALTALVEKGPDQLSDHQKTAWALFLNSLIERDPRRLWEREAAVPEMVSKLVEEHLARCPDGESRARWLDALDGLNLEAIGCNTLREHMVREIADEQVVEFLKTRTWGLVSLQGLGLITADAPLVVNCGQSEAPIQTMALAVGPQHLFLLCPPNWDLSREFLGQLLLFHNLSLVDGPAQYLYAHERLEDGALLKMRKAVEGHFRRS